MSQHKQHTAQGQERRFMDGTVMGGYSSQQKAAETWTTRTLLLLWFLLTLGLTLVFGFISDRPSRVAARRAAHPADRGRQTDQSKKVLARLAVWLSAAFHIGVSLTLLSGFASTAVSSISLVVLIGLVHLPLAVLIAARRRSGHKDAPYKIKTLIEDVRDILTGAPDGESISSDEVRSAKIFRYMVLAAVGATALLGILSLFKLPVGGFLLLAGGITWALWMRIAWKAAGMNMAVEADNTRVRVRAIAILRQVFGGAAAEWEGVVIDMEGADLVATNIPLFVALRTEDADSILAKIAPEWELGDCTPDRIVLEPVSDDTLARRDESARSGGLIGGRIDSITTENPAPTATVTIAAADFFA